MSQTRKVDGCHECSKRRIKCDKTEPKCIKCQKKGILCTGQGIRYRFCDGQPSRARGKKRQITLPRKSLSQALLPASNSTHGWLDDDQKYATSTVTEGGHEAEEAIQNPIRNEFSSLDAHDAYFSPRPIANPTQLDPKTRMLFQHFSIAIAPIMVVLDTQPNGYRNFILPLACEYPIVQRAVLVVAAFHLSAQIPELLQAAELGQLAIITKLRQDSASSSSSKPFNLCTWATILVLLAGETVTGGGDFIYLLEMLKYMMPISETEVGDPTSVCRFLLEQSKMFELFGFPLSQEAKGKLIMQNPDHYLDFISYPLDPQSKLHTDVNHMKSGIRIACEIYRRRAESDLSHNESIGLLEKLRHAVLDIDHLTEGAHALVWTYFIAAAESVLPSHRDFFTERLRALYDRTKFRSIPSAVKALDNIWALQGVRRWTKVIGDETPVLVM